MTAADLIADLKAAGWTIVTAESCTGGLVAAALTDVPGSSEVFEGGIVAYSNRLKEDLLGVPSSLLAAHGAVSAAVARAMAEGALARTGADVALAVTGIAGPGGGSAEKPVGLVHFAAATKAGQVLHRERRYGDLGRAGVRAASVMDALDLAQDALSPRTSS